MSDDFLDLRKEVIFTNLLLRSGAFVSPTHGGALVILVELAAPTVSTSQRASASCAMRQPATEQIRLGNLLGDRTAGVHALGTGGHDLLIQLLGDDCGVGSESLLRLHHVLLTTLVRLA